MGATNLQLALTHAYRRWLGERDLLRKQIARIEEETRSLEDKRARADQCDRLISSVDIIMSEVSEEWDPAAITPAQRHVSSLPFETGDGTRWTMDVLRRSPEPMRAVHIAKQITEEQGFDVTDKDFVRRVGSMVDGSLRSMMKRNHVDRTSESPSRWYIVGRDYPKRS